MTAQLRIARQTINILVDPETRNLSGVTDLDIQPVSRIPAHVLFLNARQMIIDSVLIDESSVPFKYVDSHEALKMNSGPFIRDAAHFTSVCGVVLESPDLIIPLPSPPPLSVRVIFHVRDDSTAVTKDESILFTDNWANGPSSWFPCIDNRSQRSIFSLSVTFSSDLVCIGPGKANLINNDRDPKMTTMNFRVPFAVSPSAIGFMVGPFTPTQFENPGLMGYSLDSSEVWQNTMKPLPVIMNRVLEFLDYDDDSVLSSISFVLLPFLSNARHFVGICCLPLSMTLPIGNVNVIPVVIPLLIEAVLSQYFLFLFPISIAKLEWLRTGFILYFADRIGQEYFTSSSRLDRRWNDVNLVFVEDVRPSVVPNAVDPATGDPYPDEFLRIKAKLLINMIATTVSSFDILKNLVRKVMRHSEDTTGFATDHFMAD
jgi:hypothetical protein